METVLVLDGNERSALAAVRSLGRHGAPVLAGADTPDSLAGRSRYCSGRLRLPSAGTDPTTFVDSLRHAIEDHRVGVVLPMTDITTSTLLQYRQAIDSVRIPFPSYATYSAASDKSRLFRLAHALGVPVPETCFVRSYEDIAKCTQRFHFPVVVKPSCSRMWLDGKWLKTSVTYAHSPEELNAIVRSYDWFPSYPLLIQEWIEGTGQGVFALYEGGEPVGHFAHRRLREKPPAGGVSVLCESTPVNDRMRAIADRLLNHLGWHGVAMVEFKVAPDGTPFLMEINGRFWGSLQLAIDSGVDFPWLLYQLARGRRPSPIGDYACGRRSRWLLGDLDRLYLVFKGAGGARLRETLAFLNFFDRSTNFDTLRLNDPSPFLFETSRYLETSLRSLAGRFRKVER